MAAPGESIHGVGESLSRYFFASAARARPMPCLSPASRIGRSLTPSMTCPMRSLTGRSRDRVASCSRSIVCIEKLDDLARLAKAGLFLRLFGARSACFERVGDGANDWVVAIEQVQVLL